MSILLAILFLLLIAFIVLAGVFFVWRYCIDRKEFEQRLDRVIMCLVKASHP